MSYPSHTASVERDSTDNNDKDPTRKRKREHTTETDIDTRPFTIQVRPRREVISGVCARLLTYRKQSDSPDPFAKPQIFTPECLLPRADLPLIYLDTAATQSRLFAAQIDILESCHHYQHEANVLIVQSENKSLYAVERVRRRRYALCRLAQWVCKDDLLQRAALNLPFEGKQKKRQALQPLKNGEPWWTSAAVEHSLAGSKGHTTSRLNLLPALDAVTRAASEKVLPPEIAPEMSRPIPLEAEEDAASTKPNTPEESLEELTRQYLDALYLSRTPLAYFVKGPLSRARSAFASMPHELVSFLRGSILTQSVLDKKYRESIADLVKELPILETPPAKPKSRRKRKWKPKRDKQGLFVNEKDYIEQWWRKDDESVSAAAAPESLDATLKRRAQKLRIRETFLQLIVVLETLAVELAMPPIPALVADAQSQSIEMESQIPDHHTGLTDRIKKKRDVDLNAVLETILDRLCIFYSLESSSPVKLRGENNGSSEAEANDDLRSFCTEVIIPFFASRIPAVASIASKKLGGPSAPELKGRKSAGTIKKPGEPASRQPPEKKPRKPLERASTDTLNHLRNQPPSLQRSATDQDALAPLIKRERSETPKLKDIPTAKSNPGQAVARKRSSLMDQYSASNRQIDFSAMSQVNEAKIRRKNEVDEKLREALKGIKKPNRALATEEAAKNADESFARAIAVKSKAGKPQAHRSAIAKEPVAITATPRHIKATPAPRRRQETGSNGKSGATSIVPSSSARLLARPETVPESSFAVPQTGRIERHRNVEDTPSRGFAKYMPQGLSRPPGTLLESPTMSRTAPIVATPAKPLRMPTLAETPVAKPATAARATGLDTIVDASPDVIAQIDDSGVGLEGVTAYRDTSVSVYASLGWDEEEYEELT